MISVRDIPAHCRASSSSVRIASSSYSPDLECVAFKNPDGSRVLVVMNKGEKARPMVLRFKNQVAKYEIAAHAITTFLF